MSPQNTLDLLIECANNNDLDGIMALYDPEAVFTVSPGKVVKGIKAIRDIFAHILKLGVSVTIEKTAIIEAGDIATCINRVRIKGGGFGSDPLMAFDVLRRAADGKWLFVIDNGSGTGYLE